LAADAATRPNAKTVAMVNDFANFMMSPFGFR
jgi:hypothetical protein